MIEKAYAKINIALNVIRKRNDGYHDLQMVMLPIDIYDTLTFNDSVELVVTQEGIPQDENIITKAIMLLKEKYNIKKNIEVIVTKRIPSQAGLGGGSSDAATTLKALNKLWDLHLTNDELKALASNLGKDVPFFIDCMPSLATKTGDRLEEIHIDEKTYEELTGLIVKPCFGISTKDAYSSLTEYHDRTSEIRKLIDALSSGEPFYQYLFNDFEESTLPQYEKIWQIKEHLHRYDVKGTIMSGSGSSIVCFCSEEKAKFIRNIIEKDYAYVKEFKVKRVGI